MNGRAVNSGCAGRQMMEAATEEEGEKLLLEQAFQWREMLQRGIDGCDTSADMSPDCLAKYSELPGPNIPLPCGYSVTASLIL